MAYCNVAIISHPIPEIKQFINAFFTSEEDKVTDTWWAKKHFCDSAQKNPGGAEIKCNVWLVSPDSLDSLLWSRVHYCLLVANLSDPNVIKNLELYKKMAINQSLIILGIYPRISPLNQKHKIAVLEWSGNYPFIEVNLDSAKIPMVWEQIINHISQQD